MLGDYGAAPPPAYDELVAVSPRALHARPGRGSGNVEGLSRRGAVRVPEGRRGGGRQTAEERGRRASARAGAGVPARKPVTTSAGERVQRGRVGDARGDNSGSVSSRTRSRSIRRRGSGGRRGSLEEFAYVSRML